MNTQILELIRQKEEELTELKTQYNNLVETVKRQVLKTKGFDKVLYLLGFVFESSSGRTEQYSEFHRVFKREFTAILKPHIKEIDIHKPNHFDVNGFFKLNNGEIYYFSIGDLRWNKEDMLIRTAKDFKDYNGGHNNEIPLNKDFIKNLFKYLKIEGAN